MNRSSQDRRDLDRVPVEMYLNQYVAERPHRAVTTNVSPTGLYLHRVLSRRPSSLGRDSRFVQLEFRLPDTSETIWARGEVCRDEIDLPASAHQDQGLVHGTGIRIIDIPRGHARLMRDYVIDQKRKRLQEILELIRRNRYH